MNMPEQQWVFGGTIMRVVDGDTIDVKIDQGMHTYRIERLRLLRVNAPEMHGDSRAAGIAAKHFVEQWMVGAYGSSDTWALTIQSYRSDDFGRYLAEVWRHPDGANLSDDLLTTGHAVPFQR